MGQLEGKRVLVTGAARRIGREIALHLHSLGARVLIHYGSSEVEAREVSALCGGAPLYQANLESVDEIKAMFGKVEEAGGLDGLVNNAARFTRIPPLEVTEDDWDFIHSVNLKGYFFCAQQAALVMRRGGRGVWGGAGPGGVAGDGVGRGGGRIVNISSMGAFLAWPEHVHYCASKAGVVGMTRALAKALAPEITVNSVAPGMIRFAEEVDPRIRKIIADTPVGRAGTGKEVAEGVAYFLGASEFVTGQVLQVDGGMGLR